MSSTPETRTRTLNSAIARCQRLWRSYEKSELRALDAWDAMSPAERDAWNKAQPYNSNVTDMDLHLGDGRA